MPLVQHPFKLNGRSLTYTNLFWTRDTGGNWTKILFYFSYNSMTDWYWISKRTSCGPVDHRLLVGRTRMESEMILNIKCVFIHIAIPDRIVELFSNAFKIPFVNLRSKILGKYLSHYNLFGFKQNIWGNHKVSPHLQWYVNRILCLHEGIFFLQNISQV